MWDIAPIPSSTIWKKKGIFKTFSESSRRTIKEVGNIEFCELGETFKTSQCPSCLKYSKEGTVYCSCGICLTPSPEQTEKIKNRIDIISNPPYIIKEGQVGERHSTSTVAVRSLESDGHNKRSKQEKLLVYRAPMAY